MLPKAGFVRIRVATEWACVSFDVVVHIQMIMKEFLDGETFSTDWTGVAVLVQVNSICVSYQTSL